MAESLKALSEGRDVDAEDIATLRDHTLEDFLNGMIRDRETTDWTPVASGLTVGDGTITGKYRITGNVMDWWISFTLGSTSVIPTNPKFIAPGNSTIDGSSGTVRYPGPAMAYDSSAGTFYSGVCYAGDSSDTVLTTRIIFNTATVSATSPFTWATGDLLVLSGSIVIVS